MKDWSDDEGGRVPPSQDGPVHLPPSTTVHTGMPNYLANDLRQVLRDLDAGLVTTASDQLTRIVERVERYATELVTVDATTELQVSGLDPDQEIRVRAAEIVFPGRSTPWELGDVVEVIDAVAAYIRDGSKPA